MGITISPADLQTAYADVSTTVTDALRPLIIGADLVRRTGTTVGSYVATSLVASLAGLLAGETVQPTSVGVNAASAAYRYLTHLGASPDTGLNVPTSGRSRRIRNASMVWATSAAATRSASVPVDVKVGDWCRVTNIGGSLTSKISSVAALIPEDVAATVGTATALSANLATNAGSSTASLSSGTSTATVSVAAVANPANFDGTGKRLQSETYTITVITGWTGITGTWATGTPVVLQVTSASGLDPSYTFTPIVGNNLIGTLGARITFGHGASGNDFVAGSVYTLAVTSAYTATPTASAGTFTAAPRNSTQTYRVRVTTGGSIASTLPTNAATGVVAPRAQVTVSSVFGNDSLPAAAVTTAVAVPVGAYGATVTFTAASGVLYLGDEWTISCTATADGAIRTIELVDDLGSTMESQAVTDGSVKLEFADLQATSSIDARRLGSPGTYNWTVSGSTLTLNAGITSLNSRTGTYLPLVAGTITADYSALRSANVGVAKSVLTSADCDLYLPAKALTNDLSLAVRSAISPAGTTVVLFQGVATNDLAGYQQVFSQLADREDFNYVNVVTTDETILAALDTWLDTRSAAGLPVKAAQAILQKDTVSVVVKRVGGADSTATVTDDGLTAGTQYTLVTDSSGVFVTAGIRAGDVFRTNYQSDGFGSETYDQYVVSAVRSGQQLVLVAGPALAINTAIRYEVWRPMTSSEKLAEFGTRAKAYQNQHLTIVWAGASPKKDGIATDPKFLATQIVGMYGYSAPHQGLVNAQLTGWDLTEARDNYAGLLDGLAAYGVMVCSSDYTGQAYVRNQYTTDSAFVTSTTYTKQDSIVRNRNAIRAVLYRSLSQYRGQTNLVDANINLMTQRLTAVFNSLKTAVVGDTGQKLGQLMTDGSVVSLRRHAVLTDRLVLTVSVTLPVPFNSFEVVLIDLIV